MATKNELTTAVHSTLVINAADSACASNALAMVLGKEGEAIEQATKVVTKAAGSIMGLLFTLARSSVAQFPDSPVEQQDYFRAACREAESGLRTAKATLKDGKAVKPHLKDLLGESKANTWKQVKSRTLSMLEGGYAAKFETLAAAENQRREDISVARSKAREQAALNGPASAEQRAAAAGGLDAPDALPVVAAVYAEELGLIAQALAKVPESKTQDALLALMECAGVLKDMAPVAIEEPEQPVAATA